jgi:hypothetical protein
MAVIKNEDKIVSGNINCDQVLGNFGLHFIWGTVMSMMTDEVENSEKVWGCVILDAQMENLGMIK